MKFDIKKLMVCRSERVKNVDFHSEFPWILVSLFSGNIAIYDYETSVCLKMIEVSKDPLRAAKFLDKK